MWIKIKSFKKKRMVFLSFSFLLSANKRDTFILRGLGEKFFQSKQEKFGIRNTS